MFMWGFCTFLQTYYIPLQIGFKREMWYWKVGEIFQKNSKLVEYTLGQESFFFGQENDIVCPWKNIIYKVTLKVILFPIRNLLTCLPNFLFFATGENFIVISYLN
jgi:hypothetical protein